MLFILDVLASIMLKLGESVPAITSFDSIYILIFCKVFIHWLKKRKNSKTLGNRGFALDPTQGAYSSEQWLAKYRPVQEAHPRLSTSGIMVHPCDVDLIFPSPLSYPGFWVFSFRPVACIHTCIDCTVIQNINLTGAWQENFKHTKRAVSSS